MDNIIIEKMKPEDINLSLALEDTHNIHILNADILSSDIIKSNYYYITAKINDNIVGYAGISYVIDSADIISIVVAKQYTNMGIASKMISDIFKFCKEKNIKEIFLEVRSSNIIAQKLYIKHGFKKISIRKKYYDNIEDALIYKKEL